MKRRKRNQRRGGKMKRKKKMRKVDYSLGSNPNMSLFRHFYKSQNILEEIQYSEFFSSIDQPLPITFRINGSLHPEVINSMRNKITHFFAEKIRSAAINHNEFEIEMNNRRLNHFETNLRERSDKLSPKDIEKHQEVIKGLKEKNTFISTLPPRILNPPRLLEWYPRKLAFQLDCSRQMFAKHPLIQEFRQWIIKQTERGLISRQEAVSMIPPLLFTYTPDSQILDTCAAPGSKTAQILEFLTFEQDNDEKSKERIPLGYVLANDLNSNRCQTLVHQQLRLKTLCRNLVVTNHDATRFPHPVKLINEENLSDEEKQKYQLLFDGVLCDVVCSGDGTMRKQPDVWVKWKPTMGWEFHNTQLKIALKGAEMLRDNGSLVYSTYSMQPVENEAVVAEILRQRPDLELVDVREGPLLKGLKSMEGLNYWKVMDQKGVDIGEFVSDGKYGEWLLPSMFPPTVEEVKTMNLKRCIRVLPHFNNTGGFFIALFKKKGREEEEEEGEGEEKKIDMLLSMNPNEKCCRDLDIPKWKYSQVFLPLMGVHKERISSEYGFLTNSSVDAGNCFFSHLDLDSRKKMNRRKPTKQKLLWKEDEISKYLYYGSPMVKRITEINHICRRLSIVTAGLKVFEAMKPKRKAVVNQSDYKYRLTQGGAEVLCWQIKNPKRIVIIKRQSFVVLMLNEKINRDELENRIGDKEDLRSLQEVNFTGSFLVKTDEDIVMLMFSSKNYILRSVSNERLDRIKIRMNVKL